MWQVSTSGFVSDLSNRLAARRLAVGGLAPSVERRPGGLTRPRMKLLGVLLGLAFFGQGSLPAGAQSSAEETCAAALSLRYPGHIERAIQMFPQDPCIPVMLSALPARVLSQLSPELVASLPRSQLERIAPEVLAALGIRLPAPSSRSVGASQGGSGGY